MCDIIQTHGGDQNMSSSVSFGYVRVSSRDQNEARQIEKMKELGIDERHIFVDKESGKDFDREQYRALMAMLRDGAFRVPPPQGGDQPLPEGLGKGPIVVADRNVIQGSFSPPDDAPAKGAPLPPGAEVKSTSYYSKKPFDLQSPRQVMTTSKLVA